MNWTAIDSSYTSADYTGNGVYLWGALQDTTANTTAYLYHRIDITANNGDATYTGFAEIELNTVSAADYFLVGEGVMYSSSDVAQERMYLGELKTDSNGDVIAETLINYPVGEQELTSVKVHEDLTVYGEINSEQACTAWVNFDGTQNPPLIRDSHNVVDVVDEGTGMYAIIFDTPMDDEGYSIAFAGGYSPNYADKRASVVDVNGIHKSKLQISTIYTSTPASPVDFSKVLVNIFGGKKIK